MRRDKGFTLIELLVVTVLGALLVVATFNVLITNQRIYTAQTAQMHGQQSVRAAMEILFQELREISSEEGDLLTMGDHEIAIRVMRASGMVCDTVFPAGDTDVHVLNVPVEDVSVARFAALDSVFLFAEHDSSTVSDDVWMVKRVQAVTDRECEQFDDGGVRMWGPYDGQTLRFGGNAFQADTPTFGSLVRTFSRLRFHLDSIDGEAYLARTMGGTTSPLVGPLADTDGVTFTYLDADGNVTATATDVAQIEVKIRTVSEVRDRSGNLIGDSLIARVFVRN